MLFLSNRWLQDWFCQSGPPYIYSYSKFEPQSFSLGLKQLLFRCCVWESLTVLRRTLLDVRLIPAAPLFPHRRPGGAAPLVLRLLFRGGGCSRNTRLTGSSITSSDGGCRHSLCVELVLLCGDSLSGWVGNECWNTLSSDWPGVQMCWSAAVSTSALELFLLHLGKCLSLASKL